MENPPCFVVNTIKMGGFSMVMLVSGRLYFLPSPFTAQLGGKKNPRSTGLVRYGTCTGIDAWLGVFFGKRGKKHESCSRSRFNNQKRARLKFHSHKINVWYHDIYTLPIKNPTIHDKVNIPYQSH